jgi:ABC-type antimicrobial peptide transport system permease subunit
MSYNPPEGVPYQQPNSSMAIVSLVAGILGITFFPLLGSIVALITGYSARKEIRESAGTLGGDGMATAGLVMGWIGIGLSLIGVCIACAVFGLIPLIAIVSESSNWILPGLVGLIF